MNQFLLVEQNLCLHFGAENEQDGKKKRERTRKRVTLEIMRVKAKATTDSLLAQLIVPDFMKFALRSALKESPCKH